MSIALPATEVTYLCTYWSAQTGDCVKRARRALTMEDRETLSPMLSARTENCIRALCPEHLARMEGIVAEVRSGEREPEPLTPREEFEEAFGTISAEQWQWLKEFCLRHPVTGHANPRTYTGDFPLDGSVTTVDELVAALATSVERVRIKYGFAVDVLADEMDDTAANILHWIDTRHTASGQIPYRIGEQKP